MRSSTAAVRRRPSRRVLLRCRAMKDGDAPKSKSPTPKPKTIPTTLAVGATAVAGAAAVAALATVDGLDLEDFLYGDGVTTGLLNFGSAAAAGGSGGLGTLAGSVLWSLGWRLVSPAQLLLLFIGRIDGDAPTAWAEDLLIRNFLSPEEGKEEGEGGTEPGPETPEADLVARRRLASLLSYFFLFLPAGALTACSLDLSLGDPTWSISSGLGALAAGLLFAVGRPPAAPLPGSDAERRSGALRAAFESFARGEGDSDPFSPPSTTRRKTVLERRGRCHESEVFKAFRKSRAARAALRDLARAAAAAAAENSSSSPFFESEFSDKELRAEMRRWHGEGGSERRTSQGYWKNLSLVVVEEEAGE